MEMGLSGGIVRPNGMGANLIVRRSHINVGNGWDSSNETHKDVAVVQAQRKMAAVWRPRQRADDIRRVL